MAEKCFAAYEAKCAEDANEGHYEHSEEQARNFKEKLAEVFSELDGSTSCDDFDHEAQANWSISIIATILTAGFSKMKEELNRSDEELIDATKSLIEKFFGVVEKLKSIRSDEKARHEKEYEVLGFEEKYELLHRIKTTIESLIRDLKKDHKLSVILPYLPIPFH